MRFPSNLLMVFICAAIGLHPFDPGLPIVAQDADRPSKIRFFEKSVRPLLLKECSDCHGEKKQESGLRVDRLQSLLQGGDSGPAIVPGDPDQSLLISAVEHAGDLEMPPEQQLKAEQIALLRRWIKSGAVWPAEKVSDTSRIWDRHWAFQRIRLPVVPEVPPDYRRWVNNPVDAFVLQQIIENRLQLAPAADKLTLARRACFDLHGVGPTIEQVQEFEQNRHNDSFTQLVAALLESPRYGEKSARLWMDVARYADNKGYVFFEDKAYPWAWTYRDWLIEAFNEDLPFDQFVIKQLAADLLPNRKSDRDLRALGFLTVGAKFVNNIHDQIDDSIDVVTRGFMGLTVTCARCHDHKFDPIPQADYYSLYGVFRSSHRPIVLPTYEPEPASKEYLQYKQGLESRKEKLQQFVDRQRQIISSDARQRISQYLIATFQRRHHPPTDNFMTLTEKGQINPKMISRYEKYLKQAKKTNHPVWSVWHAYLDLIDTELATRKTAAHSAENSDSNTTAGDQNPLSPEPTEDEFAKIHQKLLKFLNQETNAPINAIVAERFRKSDPTSIQSVANLYESVFHDTLLKRNNGIQLTSAEQDLIDCLEAQGSPAVLPTEFGWGFLDLIPDRPTQGAYQKILKDLENFTKSGPHAPPRAMVLNDRAQLFEPQVFLRGNPHRKGQSVKRQFLTSIPNTESLRQVFPNQQSGRLQLAKAIANDNNPLTARVIVNRVWQQHFGTGLVSTPSDFGLQGSKPSHPELLDWLAHWLMQNGWSLKKLHQLIMTSATYQRSSRPTLTQMEIDPANRLLARYNRQRLSFEAMRDSMLMATGKLNSTLGGKSFKLFQGLTPRRTVYGFVNRMDLPGVLRTFDFPEPMATSGRREMTTVPAQALFFLNHDLVANCAREIANRPDLKSATNDRLKIARIYQLLFARQPTGSETKLGLSFLTPRNISGSKSNWLYGFGSLDPKSSRTASFTELRHFVSGRWQGGPVLPDPQLSWLYHAKDESHPGAAAKLAAIRRWVSPVEGVVSVKGLLEHQPSQGNGVRCYLISSRQGKLGQWQVHHSKTETHVTSIKVKQGDVLDFVSDFNGEISYDQHKWSIKIIHAGHRQTWDSVQEFRGKYVDRLQSYVHALLMTNEFLFVD